MSEYRRKQQSPPGPFGMGRQGYLIVAIIILVTALFASTRSDWTSMVVSAIIPPLIMFPLIFTLSRRWQERTTVRDRSAGSREGGDLLTFLARTNPIMFLFFGTLSRRSDDDQYQQLLKSGPYGMGQQGYLVFLTIILAPLVLTLIITAVTGHQPTHAGLHFP